MNSFFRSFTHLVSVNTLNYTSKRVQTALKPCSTFFRLTVKTGYVDIPKDTHVAIRVSVAHWCRRSTDTLPVFGSNAARSTLFFIFQNQRNTYLSKCLFLEHFTSNQTNYFTKPFSNIFSFQTFSLKEFG